MNRGRIRRFPHHLPQCCVLRSDTLADCLKGFQAVKVAIEDQEQTIGRMLTLLGRVVASLGESNAALAETRDKIDRALNAVADALEIANERQRGYHKTGRAFYRTLRDIRRHMLRQECGFG